MLTLPELEVRPVRKSDLGSVVGLEESCFDDPYPRYFLEELADGNPDTFLVAVSEGKVVGYAVVDRWEDNNHLISIAVDADRRRSGIGQRLLSALMTGVRDGRPWRLEVRRSNVAAVRFYLKNGFRDVGVEEGCYRDGEDALLMEKGP